jgi:hypothetical protein
MAGQPIPIQKKEKILEVLQKGELTISGQFMHSSNYTFLAMAKLDGEEIKAVYKPQKGESPLWDFPSGSLCQREVAAYFISEALGWELVPATVFRKKGPLGKGALQLYVEHDPGLHYFSFDKETLDRLMPAVIFDLIINNADRKGSHILMDKNKHLWLIDHGTCFHREFKLRSVIWDFAGENIPDKLLDEIKQLEKTIGADMGPKNELYRLLRPEEMRALRSRIRILIQSDTFPFVDENRRAYPWPPL